MALDHHLIFNGLALDRTCPWSTWIQLRSVRLSMEHMKKTHPSRIPLRPILDRLTGRIRSIAMTWALAYVAFVMLAGFAVGAQVSATRQAAYVRILETALRRSWWTLGISLPSNGCKYWWNFSVTSVAERAMNSSGMIFVPPVTSSKAVSS
jgi:hypothetical protein